MIDEVLRRRVAELPYWYHTLDLGPGVVTPGHYDIRPVVDELPWPDVRGKRCLDVATFDGFWAFELERRGAAEVTALDLDDVADLDWLPRQAHQRPARGIQPIGAGFRIAREALGSQVQRRTGSVYDLRPDEHGTFDVVLCGALLQHLRDPVAALEAMRSVCAGVFVSMERVDVRASLGPRRRPLAVVTTRRRTWALPNVAGHRAWVEAAGFDVDATRLLGVPLGSGGLAEDQPAGGWRGRGRHALQAAGRRALTGSAEPPFSVLVARPSPELG